MGRISRHQAFMQTAQVWAKRSTCMRRNIGAVIVIQNRLVSTGYNGSPAGEPHCLGALCILPGEVGCSRAIHAEINALDRVPESLTSEIKLIYTTESPCMACAARIAVSNVEAVYFENKYRITSPLDFLRVQNIKCYQLNPNGNVIDYVTGEIIEDAS